MKDCCFYVVYDFVFREMARGMVRSVKRFYPDIPFIEYEIDHREKDGVFDLENYTDKVLDKGRELLGEYKRVIMMDPDQIMCNKCPDLFDDYELGVVQNNVYGENVYGETEPYINAGLEVCTSKEIWQAIIDELNKRRKDRGFDHLDHQNALNWVYHTSPNKDKFKLLEFDDRCYGITGMFLYREMELQSDGLYLPKFHLNPRRDKRLCLFHAAGTAWKTGNMINFDLIKNESARNMLISYTK